MPEKPTLPKAAGATEPIEDVPTNPETAAPPQNERESLNLYAKLLRIEEAIGSIEKTGKNTNQNYSFIEQAHIVARLTPLFVSMGVKCISREIANTIVPKEKWSNDAKGVVPAGSKSLKHVEYKFINVDHPTETTEWLGFFSEGDDSLDKASNKASTANQKYFYIRQFNISDQDTDELSPDEGSVQKPSAKLSKSKETDIYTMLERIGVNIEDYNGKLLAELGVDDVSKLTNAQADQQIASMAAYIQRKRISRGDDDGVAA